MFSRIKVYLRKYIGFSFYRCSSYIENKILEGIRLEPQYPPLFIIGPPRCGTTILFLYVVNSWNFSYFPNISKYHPQAPLSYGLLGYRFNQYFPTFKSKYGIVDQLMAPSDGWDIFLRWFKNEYQANPSYDQVYKLKTQIRFFERLLGGPFCVRNNVNSLRIAHLKKVFPNALFLGITRDYREAAVSLNRAYRENRTPDTEWWSAGPPDYKMDEFENSLEKAVFQILGVEAVMRRDFESLEPRNKFLITYDKFCDNPKQIKAWIEDAYQRRNFNLQKRDFYRLTDSYVNKSSRLSNKMIEYEEEMNEYLCRFLKGKHLKSKKVLSDEVRTLVKVQQTDMV